MTQAPTVNDAAVQRLGDGFRGQLLKPTDQGYDSARAIFNAMIDRRPSLIARPADTNDVKRSVRFAREHELVVSVKGGGHAASGHAVCEGGLMIDLSLMKALNVDPVRKQPRLKAA